MFLLCMVKNLLLSCTTNDERNQYLGMLSPGTSTRGDLWLFGCHHRATVRVKQQFVPRCIRSSQSSISACCSNVPGASRFKDLSARIHAVTSWKGSRWTLSKIRTPTRLLYNHILHLYSTLSMHLEDVFEIDLANQVNILRQASLEIMNNMR